MRSRADQKQCRRRRRISSLVSVLLLAMLCVVTPRYLLARKAINNQTIEKNGTLKRMGILDQISQLIIEIRCFGRRWKKVRWWLLAIFLDCRRSNTISSSLTENFSFLSFTYSSYDIISIIKEFTYLDRSEFYKWADDDHIHDRCDCGCCSCSDWQFNLLDITSWSFFVETLCHI